MSVAPDIGRKILRQVKRRDRIARWVVTLGGIGVIASVLAILVLIVGTTIPLFLPARTNRVSAGRISAPNAADVLAIHVDRSLDGQSWLAWTVARNGTATRIDLVTGQAEPPVVIDRTAKKAGRSIRSAEQVGASSVSLVWSDGAVSLVEFPQPRWTAGAPKGPDGPVTRVVIPPEKDALPAMASMRRSQEGAVSCACLMPDNRVVVTRQISKEDMFGEVSVETQRLVLSRDIPGPILALTLDSEGKVLYASTANGCLLWWRFGDAGEVVGQDVIPAFRDKRPITALAVMLGDAALAVGDGQGEVTNWFLVRTRDNTRKLRLVRSLDPHPAMIRQIVPSLRNRALLTLDQEGLATLDYTTSRRALATFGGDEPWRKIALSPRGDGVLGLTQDGHLVAWQVDCPHPEISWQTLLGKVFYEGYEKPEHVWQTTGGDDYEAKLSLVPLLFGTVKGTIYAMLFAAPLALAAAAYISHFCTPAYKRVIKPAIEIMAAFPSVIIGFLAALWLAPLLETGLVTVLASLLTIPVLFLLTLALWQTLRHYDWAKRVANGREFLLLVPVIVAGVALAVWLAGPLERVLFDGNLRLWMAQHFDIRYDQRNCIVIAFALGFAVIPIIFSLAEDSLSSVPHSMTAASMALGGSRWQTLWRVVLPSASPGIFAAVMIGFGRAVGETMIVLMATGNTAIMDWLPFNGMRTFSANIAVEIPEAPVGGTLYRVLFLCAVFLFMLTFALNTVAEIVRQRLRKRYGQY